MSSDSERESREGREAALAAFWTEVDAAEVRGVALGETALRALCGDPKTGGVGLAAEQTEANVRAWYASEKLPHPICGPTPTGFYGPHWHGLWWP